MPTTVFLLIALWAFARGSPRFHTWLYTHPRFGPPLQAWDRHGVIRPGAKVVAIVAMAASLAITIRVRSEEHTPELQSLMRTSNAVFGLKKKKQQKDNPIKPKQS